MEELVNTADISCVFGSAATTNTAQSSVTHNAVLIAKPMLRGLP
jgi:hypothetical protein